MLIIRLFRTFADDIKKRFGQHEDMFLRRLFGMLAKMAKTDRPMIIFCPSVVDL